MIARAACLHRGLLSSATSLARFGQLPDTMTLPPTDPHQPPDSLSSNGEVKYRSGTGSMEVGVVNERSAKEVVEEMFRRQLAGDDTVLDDLVAAKPRARSPGDGGIVDGPHFRTALTEQRAAAGVYADSGSR
jgi:hypothetical protein